MHIWFCIVVLAFYMKIEKYLNLTIQAVENGGNAARAGLKAGDQVLYTSSFFGDELWPADKLGFTKTAIQAKPDSVYFVVNRFLIFSKTLLSFIQYRSGIFLKKISMQLIFTTNVVTFYVQCKCCYVLIEMIKLWPVFSEGGPKLMWKGYLSVPLRLHLGGN